MITSSGFRIILSILSLSMLLGACSEQPAVESAANEQNAREVVDIMLTSMGGVDALRGINSLVMTGDGTRNRLGQIPVTDGIDPDAVLEGVTETIDFVAGHAAFDHDVLIDGGFSQHRTEALTSWAGQKIAWGTTEGRPNEATTVNGLFSWATQNSPAMLLRRNPLTIALAADNVGVGQVAPSVNFNGSPHWSVVTDLDGEEITLMIDPESGLLSGFNALDTESMLGDVDAVYSFDDYRNVDGVMLPFSNMIFKDGSPYSSMNYSAIRVNDSSALAIFEFPEDITGQADQVVRSMADNEAGWVPLQWLRVSESVTHIVAFSHHSMVVEFPNFVVVVEGPYTEAQSMTAARMIEENIGKPIRYVVPSHPHYDHTGGLRGFAAAGASILTAKGHEDEIRGIIESPHTNPADALAARAADGAEVGQVEVFSGMTEISEGDQHLSLYEVTTIPHVNPIVLAYVEGDGILFQSDLFFGGPGADTTALYNEVQRLGLQVQQIVGGHGGILPYSSLVDAARAN